MLGSTSDVRPIVAAGRVILHSMRQNGSEVPSGMRSDHVHRWRGRIWTGDSGGQAPLEDGVIEHEAGRITSVRPAHSSDAPAEVDASGHPYTLLPGMVDLHNHGGDGHSFPTSSAAGCRRAAAYHRARGTTTMLASLVSADGPTLIHQSAVLADLADEEVVAGIHLEGPFLSPARCGAQEPSALIPGDPDLLRQIIEAGRGHLRSLTIAPETQHYDQLLSVCAEHNVVISLGHSDATAAEAQTALESAEAAKVPVTATHLYNAMPIMHHRDPGMQEHCCRQQRKNAWSLKWWPMASTLMTSWLLSRWLRHPTRWRSSLTLWPPPAKAMAATPWAELK